MMSPMRHDDALRRSIFDLMGLLIPITLFVVCWKVMAALMPLYELPR